MEDTYIKDEAAVIRDIAERVGRLTDDEVALVRTLTPADLARDGSCRAPEGPR